MTPVVFTDLDGSLLDLRTYDPGPARPALWNLVEAGVTVVFCSTKTEAEQSHLAAELSVTGPRVVENGAAVVISGEPAAVFGTPIDQVRRGIAAAAQQAGVAVRGYTDMTDREIAELTGMNGAAVRRARERRWSETVIVRGAVAAYGQALAAGRLRLVQGSRLWTVTGDHDKGGGVSYLRGRFGWEPAFAIGDGPNDEPMLAAADVGLVVERPGGGWAELGPPGVRRVQGVGPEGWARAAAWVLAELS